MVGQTIGKYRVVSRLGRGGMGTVYKAVDETLEREVAIKCLNPDLAEPDIFKRFRAEAITLARLNHPHIATLFELTEHAGELLMVMEFVRGDTFDKVSGRFGPMPVDRAARLCAQVLDALAYAHRAGIVHRDLKPANLMLTESGLAKVMDFGIARMVGTEHLTLDGFMMGTPAYMAPEQALGAEIDGRTDLYAMGVVFYRLLTAHLPFKADSGIAMVHKQINDPPTPVRQFRADLPPVCQEILTRAMAKAPGDRYQTAEEFRDALAALAGVGAADVTATRPMPYPEPSADLEPTLPPMPTPLAQPTLAQPPVEDPQSALPTVAQPAIPRPAVPHTAIPHAAISQPVITQAAIAPSSGPAPASARRVLVALVALVLVAGVATIGIVMWRAKQPAPESEIARSASVPSVPAAAAPTADPAAANPAPAPTAAATAAPVTKTVAVPSAAPPVKAAATVKKGQATTPAVELAVASVAPAGRGYFPPVTFANLRLLVSADGRAGDRSASLRLRSDGLDVVDGAQTLHSAA